MHANGEASCSIQLWLSFPRENALASRSSTFKLLVNFYCDSCISHNDLNHIMIIRTLCVNTEDIFRPRGLEVDDPDMYQRGIFLATDVR